MAPTFEVRFQSNPNDTAVIRQRLREIGASANQAGQQGTQAMRRLGQASQDTGRLVSGLNTQFASVTASVRQFFSSFTGNRAQGPIADINRSFREMATAAGVAGTRGQAAMRQISTGAIATSRDVSVLNTQFQSLTTTIRSFLSVWVGFRIVRNAVQTFADFEQTLRQVEAITGATTQQVAVMEETIRSLARTTQFTAREVGQGMRFLAQAGLDADESIEALEETLLLAQVGMLGMAEAADIATNVMIGFGFQAAQLGIVVDVLASAATSSNTTVQQLGTAMSYVAPIARQAGISIEETAAAVSALSDAGIQGERAGTGLRANLIQLAAAGFDLSEGLLPVLRELAQANLTIAEASDLVGRRAASSLLVLIDNADSVENLTGSYEDADGAAMEMANTMNNSLRFALRQVQSAFDELQIAILDSVELAPLVRRLAEAIIFLSDNLDILTGVIDAAGFLVLVNAFRVIAGLLPSLVSGFTTLLVSFGSAFSALNFLNGAFLTLILSFRPASQALAGIGTGFTALGNAVRFAQRGIAGLISTFARFTGVLLGFAGSILPLLAPIFVALTAGVLALSGAFARSETEQIRRFGQELLVIRDIARDLFTGLAQLITGTSDINSFGAALAALGSSFIGILGEGLVQLNLLAEAFSDLYNRIPGAQFVGGTGVARFTTSTRTAFDALVNRTTGGDEELLRNILNVLVSIEDAQALRPPEILELTNEFTREFGEQAGRLFFDALRNYAETGTLSIGSYDAFQIGEGDFTRAQLERFLFFLQTGGGASIGPGGRIPAEEGIRNRFGTGEGSRFAGLVADRERRFQIDQILNAAGDFTDIPSVSRTRGFDPRVLGAELRDEAQRILDESFREAVSEDFIPGQTYDVPGALRAQFLRRIEELDAATQDVLSDTRIAAAFNENFASLNRELIRRAFEDFDPEELVTSDFRIRRAQQTGFRDMFRLIIENGLADFDPNEIITSDFRIRRAQQTNFSDMFRLIIENGLADFDPEELVTSDFRIRRAQETNYVDMHRLIIENALADFDPAEDITSDFRIQRAQQTNYADMHREILRLGLDDFDPEELVTSDFRIQRAIDTGFADMFREIIRSGLEGFDPAALITSDFRIRRAQQTGFTDFFRTNRDLALAGFDETITPTSDFRIRRAQDSGFADLERELARPRPLGVFDRFTRDLNERREGLFETESVREVNDEVRQLRRQMEATLEAGESLTRTQLDQLEAARQMVAELQRQELLIDTFRTTAETATEVINDTFDQWIEDRQTSWEDFGTDLGNAFATGFVDEVIAGVDRIIEYMSLYLVDLLEGTNNTDFSFTDLANSFLGRSTIPADVPASQFGGSFLIGGRSGVDQNLLSLNGAPLTRVSQGERVSISPVAESGRGGGGIVINSPVTINEAGDANRTAALLRQNQEETVRRVREELRSNQRRTGSAF